MQGQQTTGPRFKYTVERLQDRESFCLLTLILILCNPVLAEDGEFKTNESSYARVLQHLVSVTYAKRISAWSILEQNFALKQNNGALVFESSVFKVVAQGIAELPIGIKALIFSFYCKQKQDNALDPAGFVPLVQRQLCCGSLFGIAVDLLVHISILIRIILLN